MAKYKTLDDIIYQGDTAEELCQNMQASAIFLAHESLPKYLAGFAGRIKEMEGFDVRAWPPEDFIADMQARGIITRLNDN